MDIVFIATSFSATYRSYLLVPGLSRLKVDATGLSNEVAAKGSFSPAPAAAA